MIFIKRVINRPTDASLPQLQIDGERRYFVYSDEGLVGEYGSSGQEIRTYGWAPDSG